MDKAQQLRAAMVRVQMTLDALDKAQRVSAQQMLLQVGDPHALPVRAGETCPLCRHKKNSLPKTKP